jgi:hypothetical protein
MRFDVLDEHSTLVPFGLGVSKQNRVVQYPVSATKRAKLGVIANCFSHLKALFKFLRALDQFAGREAAS